MPTEEEKETLCGLWEWRPKWLQRLASKKVYLTIYSLLGVIQGMMYTYLSAVLSNIEKQFGIKSKESAYLMSGNEISQILFLFVMPFMIKVKRRPLWTAVGLACSGIGCIIICLPHFISDSLAIIHSPSNSTMNGMQPGMCGADEHPASLEKQCHEDGTKVVDWLGLLVIFFGIVLTGIGNSCFYSFGVAYLDDNMSHENSPAILGITYTFRLLGPTLGFFLGSFCLKTYVDPSIKPDFEEGDPRWIGAWWLGFPIIGCCILALVAPLSLFPQRLPKANTDANLRRIKEAEKLTEAKDNIKELKTKEGFVKALKRLFSNKLFMFNFASNLFYVFAFMGFGTFMPKYVEFQFRKKGSSSSTFVGAVATLSKAFGLLVSGVAISKFRPSARILSGWNVILGVFYFVSLVVFSILGCPTSRVYGTNTENGIEIGADCNFNCSCPVARPEPLCSKDGVTNFYSPCIAGCQSYRNFTYFDEKGKNKTIKVYENCGCTESAWTSNNLTLSDEWIKRDYLEGINSSPDRVDQVREYLRGSPITEAVEGWCTVDCESVYKLFNLTMFLLMVLSATGRIGGVLVALRCIDIQDKSLSMAFNVVLLSLLAMLPAPIVYGAIIDSACILWQKTCGGETGNCLLYDTVELRVSLMMTTGCIMLVGVLFDVGVWYEAKTLVIFNPDQKLQSSTKLKNNVYASNLSLAASRGDLNKQAVPLGQHLFANGTDKD